MKTLGVLLDIMSDHDARFTRQFWTALFNLIGTNLKFLTQIIHKQREDGNKLLHSLRIPQILCDSKSKD